MIFLNESRLDAIGKLLSDLNGLTRGILRISAGSVRSCKSRRYHRGWDYPHVDYRPELRHSGDNWVGEEIEWREHAEELWRLYQSGQFVSVGALWYDWQGRSSENPEIGVGPVDFLPLNDTIYRFTEIFEFAARFALTEAADDFMRVDTKVANLQDRQLVQTDPSRALFRRYNFAGSHFSYPGHETDPIPQETLVANARNLAAEALLNLFRRFDFSVDLDSIRAWQAQLIRG